VIGVMSGPLGIPRRREALVTVSSSKHGALEQEGTLSHSMPGYLEDSGNTEEKKGGLLVWVLWEPKDRGRQERESRGNETGLRVPA
jgi:hypothetical protein